MKHMLCCLGKGSASNVVQETAQPSEPPQQPQPPEPRQQSQPSEPRQQRQPPQQPQPSEPRQQRQPTDSSIRVDDENDEVNDDAPFGNNEFLNYAWRNNIELPDDLEFPDSGASLFPSSPPLSADSGPSFAWHQIMDGTQNFQQTNLLGRGNFGEVYRCDFPIIDKVGAAKIQNPKNETGHLEFIAEVTTLHAANHPNVIKLLGKCYGRSNRAIVYEYMPKGSLDRYLFARARPSQVLDWETRMRIAVGVAEGLKYLHIKLKMIHGDIKAGNILLDENFVPKLTDFGLVTKVVENENGVEQQIEIRPVKGTPGCIAPETEELGLITTKSDVYSYGVFLFQLVTGRKSFDVKRPTGRMKIADWLMPVWNRQQSALLVIDAVLGNKYSVKGLDKLISAAKMCTEAEVHKRPDMYCVEMMVTEAAAFPIQLDPPVPERRSF